MKIEMKRVSKIIRADCRLCLRCGTNLTRLRNNTICIWWCNRIADEKKMSK